MDRGGGVFSGTNILAPVERRDMLCKVMSEPISLALMGNGCFVVAGETVAIKEEGVLWLFWVGG